MFGVRFMRLLLILWALPILVFGTWYGLSINNWHFGYFFLSRDMNDLFFQIYANMLGIPKEALPGLIVSALITDTLIVFGLIALRMRKRWWPYVAPYAARLFAPLTPYVAPRWARITESLSRHPWRIRLAAIWSTFSARFRRDKSASIMARSAATVDSRSSQ